MHRSYHSFVNAKLLDMCVQFGELQASQNERKKHTHTPLYNNRNRMLLKIAVCMNLTTVAIIIVSLCMCFSLLVDCLLVHSMSVRLGLLYIRAWMEVAARQFQKHRHSCDCNTQPKNMVDNQTMSAPTGLFPKSKLYKWRRRQRRRRRRHTNKKTNSNLTEEPPKMTRAREKERQR